VPIKDGLSGKKKKNKFIQMSPVLREQLHPHAKTLLDRLIKEMVNYGVTATPDRLLAMACNPLVTTLGMEELDLLLTCFILCNEPCKDILSSVKIEHHQKTCMETLEHQVKQDCALIIPNDDDNAGEQSSDVRNDDDGGIERKRVKENTAATTDEAGWGPVH
jgi:hypothetical protein